MLERIRIRFRLTAISLVLALLTVNSTAVAQTNVAAEKGKSAVAGQRLYSAGHSFHVFVPKILNEMVKAADIEDHVLVGQSFIGGSRVIQHWNVPEERNKTKKALRTGEVDVLTLSPIHLPDEGIVKRYQYP